MSHRFSDDFVFMVFAFFFLAIFFCFGALMEQVFSFGFHTNGDKLTYCGNLYQKVPAVPPSPTKVEGAPVEYNLIPEENDEFTQWLKSSPAEDKKIQQLTQIK